MLDATTNYVCSKLSEHNTTQKRNRFAKMDEFYVAPIEKALGTRFETEKNENGVEVPVLIQNTYSYVSILDTLRSLFKNEEFLKTFLDYNKNNGNGHQCKPGEYEDFCCGSIHKSHDIFRNTNIQLEIFVDDFETCNPIGSRATIHKMCGVYFRIRNMPNVSTLSSIFLIALFHSDDAKSKHTDFNDIWRVILAELKELQRIGVPISKTMSLK